MRVYGRVSGVWAVVETDANGYNDAVNLTWLCQVLKLNTGESPFYGAWGIPQYQTIMTQVFPDYYVMTTQQQFSGLFASLTIARTSNTTPTYAVSIITHYGSKVGVSLNFTADSSSVSADSPVFAPGGSRLTVPT